MLARVFACCAGLPLAGAHESLVPVRAGGCARGHFASVRFAPFSFAFVPVAFVPFAPVPFAPIPFAAVAVRFCTRVVARALLLATLTLAVNSQAQTSASATLVSDYRFRGASLSDGRPAAQANVNYDGNYDDHNAWYLGGFVSSARFEPDERSGSELLGYTGYARRFESGYSVDAGASYATFSSQHTYDYAEVHAAVASTDLTAQISYAPNYFRRGTHSLYTELNGTFSRVGRIAPFAHVGFLRLSPSELFYGPRTQIDARAGVGFSLDRMQLQLSWGTSNHEVAVYPHGRRDGKGVWVGRVACLF